MSDTNVLQPAAQNALALAEQGDITGLEDAWLEVVEDPPVTGEFYDSFFRAMRRAHELEKAHSLAVLALTELANRGNWAALLEAVETLGSRWPDSKEMRPLAAKALKGAYADVRVLPHIIATCKGVPLDRVFDHFRAYLRMLPGETYTHAYWGQGVVESLDIPAGKVTLDFAGERKGITLDFLRKHLRHLPADSFLSLRTKQPERLAEMADDDPVGLVKLVLAGAEGGRMKQSELKTLLIEGVIDEGGWASWWNRTRKALQIDPLIDFGTKGGARAELGLREKPKTLEEEVQELFFGPDADIARRVAAIQHMADTQRSTGAVLDPEAIRRMAAALEPDFRRVPPGDTATRLQYALAAEDLSALLGGEPGQVATAIPAAAVVLEGVEDYSLLLRLDPPEYAVRALQTLVARDGDQGIAEAAMLMPDASLRLAQAIWKELDAEHHVQTAVRAIRMLFEKALENPETYLWAARCIAERRWMHLDDYLPSGSFVYDLMDNLERWHGIVERGAGERAVLHAARLLVAKVRAMAQARNFEMLCAAVTDLSLDQAQDLRRVVQFSGVLTDSAREQADRQMVLTRKELETPASVAEGIAAADAAIMYCTLLGHSRAVRELHELNTVKIPKNALDIEVARAEGDLKENAGYHGARDRHVLLLQQAHELGHNISRSRVVRGENVRTAAIAFGTGFHATNVATGAQEYYIVLGRWESDPGKRVFSYQAPLIIQLMGRKVGETVTVRLSEDRETTYRIDSIENALKGSEYDAEP